MKMLKIFLPSASSSEPKAVDSFVATAPSSPVVRRSIHVRGIVQGVGFRPFVYKLAQTLGLAGFVLNSSSGVTIELEGPESAVEQFLDALESHPPPLAQIDEVVTADIELQGEGNFSIRTSRQEQSEFALVSPDVGTCADCWADFTDPQNRRFCYPFTNCTNCGPRYTIIQDIPYDRPQTTMAPFAMCELCLKEYEDPANRRFHAQPNACAVCGPSLLLRQSGYSFPHDSEFERGQSSAAVLGEARKLLHEGKILAIRGLGGFLLACDAENDAAMRTLRKRKRRSEKPFALMTRDIAAVESFCIVSAADREALLSVRRPIVILRRRADATLSREIGPGTDTLGVMLPYTPLHALLFADSPSQPAKFTALVMTSGNMSEEPIVTSNQEARERLRQIADYFLFHNRDIYMRVDDSVVRTFEGRERVLRRARGYVPHPVDLGIPVEEVLACGGELKSTFCLTKGHWAILSQHIGDMENYETLMFFEQTLANLRKLFRVTPRAVAHDLHPGYMSTRFAQQLAIEQKVERKFGVQHHHAHIASCMAENHLRGRVIGVAFDGTGYGTDGNIWGGEFLTADYEDFERRAHFRYIPLSGGDAAVRQPWRVALSYLRDTYGSGPLPDHLALFRGVPEKQLALVDTMITRRFQTISASSCGRLFDGVASLVDLKHEVTYEGQAAIALEAAAQSGVEQRYVYEIQAGNPEQVDMRPMIRQIVEDVANSTSVGEVSARFHNTIAAAVIEVCERIRRAEALDRVCLSGGSFQNMYLLKRAAEGLRRSGFEVFLHAVVPPNDGGIALGQAVIANALLRRGN